MHPASPDVARAFEPPSVRPRIPEKQPMFAIKSSFKVAVPSKGLRDRVWPGEPSMKRSRWAVAVFLAIFPVVARAQEGGAGKVPLTSSQKLGHRVFEQRCGICHAPARPGFQIGRA